MTTYLLIHGSFQGGWIWQPTAAVLRAAGHTVYAPTLDGCAERKIYLRPGITVAWSAQELAGLLFYEDLKDVVVVATSSGGLVAQKLAEHAADRIERFVFLDALMPLPDESIEDIVERGPNAPPYDRTEFTRAPSREAMANGLFAELTGEM